MPILEEIRTVTVDGRVVIPWVIQRALGLEHGGPVRFRVEDGVVTVHAMDGRASDNARAANDIESRRPDIRTALATELRTLLDAAERDRANQVAAR